jgi:hypothetical protein
MSRKVKRKKEKVKINFGFQIVDCGFMKIVKMMVITLIRWSSPPKRMQTM